MQLDDIIHRIGVTRVANITGLDRIGLPVACAIRPLTRSLSVSFGKGETWELAFCSAVMEAAELFFSECLDCERRFTTLSGLTQNEIPIDLSKVLRAQGEQDISGLVMPWVAGEDLITGMRLWVPAELVSMDFSIAARKTPRHFASGATGLAAAFDENSAILHALYEIVERDAHAAWNRTSDYERENSLVDLSTIRCPVVRNWMDRIERAGLDIVIWDLTGKTNLPCYMVEVIDFSENATTAYSQGTGCDLSSPAAIRKALFEAVQVRLTYIAGSRDDLSWSDYGARFDRIVSNRWNVVRKLSASKAVPLAPQVPQTCLAQIAEVSRRLTRSSVEQIAKVNLTKPGEPVSVVKIVIPSLIDVDSAHLFEPDQMASAYG